MYIVYGGYSAIYEHFSIKYKSVQVESFVFQKPPQNHILNVGIHGEQNRNINIIKR